MNDEQCPECGEPLSDFTSCGCCFVTRETPKEGASSPPKAVKYEGGGMRRMVERKLGRLPRVAPKP